MTLRTTVKRRCERCGRSTEQHELVLVNGRRLCLRCVEDLRVRSSLAYPPYGA